MANIVDRDSLNQDWDLLVDADPSAAPGLDAPVGSRASLENWFGQWTKTGAGVTDWTREDCAAFAIGHGSDTGSVTQAHRRVVIGSNTSRASGSECLVAASEAGHASGQYAAVVGCFQANASCVPGAIVGSGGFASDGSDCVAADQFTAILASYGDSTRIVSTSGGACTAVIGSQRAEVSSCNGSVIMASYAVGLDASTYSAVVACDYADVSSSHASAIIACSNDFGDWPTITSTAEANLIAGSSGDVNIIGDNCVILAGRADGFTGCIADGEKVLFGACDGVFNSHAASANLVVLASSWGAGGVTLTDTNAVVGGTAGAKTWRIQSTTGVGHFNGGTAAGADYAEFFENLTPGTLPPCSLVINSADKVLLARTGDRILGVVSSNPALVANERAHHWHGRFERDSFGAHTVTQVDCVRWRGWLEQTRPSNVVGDYPVITREAREGYDGPVADAPPVDEWPGDAEEYVCETWTEDAAFDPVTHPPEDYVPRGERPDEWTVVGLLGRIRVRVDATVDVGSYVAPSDAPGIGTSAPGVPLTGCSVECLRIDVPYDDQVGYGLALCLVR